MRDVGPALFVRGWSRESVRACLVVERRSAWTPDDFDRLHEVIKSFVGVATRGGFSCDAASRADSRMALAGGEFQSMTARFAFDAHCVDSRAFVVLRNAVWGLVDLGESVSAVGILGDAPQASESSRIPPVDDDGIDNAYPAFASPTAFDVVREPGGDSRARRCVVEHAGPVPPTRVLALRGWVDAWFDVVELGGFSMPDFHPASAGSVRGGIAQLDDCSVEVSLLRYTGSEALWSVLLNLVADYHFHERAVQRVILE